MAASGTTPALYRARHLRRNSPMSLLLLAGLMRGNQLLTASAGAAQPTGFGTLCTPSELRAPPRGWNSYDSSPPWTGPDGSTEASTEAVALRDAAQLASTLLPRGYDTFTLDSGWFGEDNKYGTQTIDDFGRLTPNVTQFPSSAGGVGFAPLGAKIHAHGLKFGIWIMGGVPRMAVEAKSKIKGSNFTAADIAIVGDDPSQPPHQGKATGSMDCPWNPWLVHGINMSHPGAQEYIDSLADLYATEWKLDFLKVDCVFGQDWFRGETFVRRLIEALQKRHRPVVISLSPGSSQPNATLAAAARDMASSLGQPIMARLTGDFWDVWGQLKAHFAYAAELEQYSTRLFSPDLDMLPMGWIAHVGTGPRYSTLTVQEQRAMMTMWIISRAPLIWGGDPTRSNASTLELLSDQAALEVQETTCRNHLLASVSTNESVVWAAQSSKRADARIVAMFNLGDSATVVKAPWSALGLKGPPAESRALWRDASPISSSTLALESTLQPHDAVLVEVFATGANTRVAHGR